MMLPTDAPTGDTSPQRWPPGPVVALMVGVIVLAAVHGAITIFPHRIGFINNQFNMDLEGNVPTWFAAFVWGIAGAVMVAWAMAVRRHSETWPPLLYAPAAAFLLLSLDEISGFHESLGHEIDQLVLGGSRDGTLLDSTGVWVLVLVPVALVVAALLAWGLREHLRRAAVATALFVTSGVALVIAGGVELLSNFVADRRVAYYLSVMVEEGLELTAGVAAVWGAMELVRVERARSSRPG